MKSADQILLEEAYQLILNETAIGSAIPTVLYHVTKASSVNSIMKNGLESRIVTVPGLKTRTPRIYLFSNINSENIDMIELFQHKIEHMGGMMASRVTTPPERYQDVAVIKVTIPKGVKVYQDPLIHNAATNAYFISNKTIDPQYLEVVYEGPIRGKNEKSLKSFTKKHGIAGEPYKVRIVLDSSQIKQLENKLSKLRKQAGDKVVPNSDIEIVGTKARTLSVYVLRSLKDIKFWHERLDQFDFDNLFTTPRKQLYSDSQGMMTDEVYPNKKVYKSYYYSLGVSRNELADLLVKEFNVRVATSEGEMKEIYNDMVEEMGHSELTF